ncbi:MAG: flagellar basal body P-ring formation chaperone FlgA [Verrucomicrobiota bacterium]|nr:flagellar basal body P-ring formation protein FlgA [Limisphaerales bacterium]
MKSPTLRRLVSILCLLVGPALLATLAGESLSWPLRPAVQVDGTGVFLDQVIAAPAADIPHIRLTAAPAAGQVLHLNRVQINELLGLHAPAFARTNLSGADQIKISRRTRRLEEVEMKTLLTAALQRDFVKEKGELELRFTRPWATVTVVEDALTIKVVDLPAAGVTPNCIVRFELQAGPDILGSWQVPLQARVWREVWVAGSPLQRGQLLQDADVIKERRDVLVLRDALPSLALDNPGVELAENVPTGTALAARSLRLRPIVRRGQVAEALVQDGAMIISAKVEILEDGLPGQTVRVRNVKSKREFRGKVQNEETIIVTL